MLINNAGAMLRGNLLSELNGNISVCVLSGKVVRKLRWHAGRSRVCSVITQGQC